MLTTSLLIALATPQAPDTEDPKFSAPVRMTAAGQPIQVEGPGYAAPAWVDANRDGHMDLVVGQFSGGKIMVYPGNPKGELGKGVWLQAEGEPAYVPGVW